MVNSSVLGFYFPFTPPLYFAMSVFKGLKILMYRVPLIKMSKNKLENI